MKEIKIKISDTNYWREKVLDDLLGKDTIKNIQYDDNGDEYSLELIIKRKIKKRK